MRPTVKDPSTNHSGSWQRRTAGLWLVRKAQPMIVGFKKFGSYSRQRWFLKHFTHVIRARIEDLLLRVCDLKVIVTPPIILRRASRNYFGEGLKLSSDCAMLASEKTDHKILFINPQREEATKSNKKWSTFFENEVTIIFQRFKRNCKHFRRIKSCTSIFVQLLLEG